MKLIDIPVPDIGDFNAVSVIEILVEPGQHIRPEQSLITLESDKASMEIPAPQGGIVKDIKVKLGDQIAQGTVILSLEVADPTSLAQPTPQAERPPTEQTAMPPPPAKHEAAFDCDVLVLGGGPGGYSAAFRAADLGLKVILVERYAELGGVCLNVGCIPSKALLHVASTLDQTKHLAAAGIHFNQPEINLAALRTHKQQTIRRLTQGLAGMAKQRQVTLQRGYGYFVGPHELCVESTHGAGQEKNGLRQTIRFRQAIIAAGSQAIHLPLLPDDPRIVDSTGALALAFLPKRMLLIGGGIIGLEMGTVYSSLGASLDIVEMQDGLMAGADRDIVKIWQQYNAPRFNRIMLKTKTVSAQATAAGIEVRFEGPNAPTEPQLYDLVLQAVGRQPNGLKISADQAGVNVDAKGYIPVDQQMRTNVAHIFAIGDIVGQPMLAHKAVHEGHLAAEVIAGELLGQAALARRVFEARVIPCVAYTDPEVAWVGLTEEQAKQSGQPIQKAVFPWVASGRALANMRTEGMTKLLFDPQSHRLLGASLVGQHAGDMIGELALAIEMGADAADIAQTIHPHPTLGETIGLAAEVHEGTCTDLPPVRRR